MSALREPLIEIIKRLPEERLAEITPTIQDVDAQPLWSLADALAEADAIYESLKDAVYLMPDVADILRDVREERLNAVLGLH